MKAIIIGAAFTAAFVYLFMAWVMFDIAWIAHAGEWTRLDRFIGGFISVICIIMGMCLASLIEDLASLIED